MSVADARERLTPEDPGVRVMREGAVIVACSDDAIDEPSRADLARLLFDPSVGEPLDDAAGRAAVHVLTLRNGRRCLRRRCLRGGVLAPALVDRYLRPFAGGVAAYRPMAELCVSETLRRGGVRVARTVAAGVRLLRPPLLYRGAVLTEYIPDAKNLLTMLKQGDAREDALERWAFQAGHQAAAVVRCRILPVDLHVGNVIVREDEVTLIDFDKARAIPRHWSDDRAVRMIRARWRRSAMKHGSESLAEAFARGLDAP